VGSSTRKKEPVELKQNQYKRYMCNYFSLGVESRVGLGFEKKRTSNAICNKCVYFCEGIKKFMCCRGRKRTLKVKECVDYVATIDS
jgi:diacylglycerol kinase (ATP)